MIPGPMQPEEPQVKKLIQFDWAIKTLLRRKANFPILAPMRVRKSEFNIGII